MKIAMNSLSVKYTAINTAGTEEQVAVYQYHNIPLHISTSTSVNHIDYNCNVLLITALLV